MNRRNRGPGTAVWMSLVLFATLGCASERQQTTLPREQATWVRDMGPSFTTIARDTAYSLVPSEGRDALIFEQVQTVDGAPPRRLTWIIDVPSVAPFDRTIRIGEAEPAARAGELLGRGWMLETIGSGRTFASPIEGTVRIQSRTADRVIATADVRAVIGAGEKRRDVSPEARLSMRLEWTLFRPAAVPTRELRSASGI